MRTARVLSILPPLVLLLMLRAGPIATGAGSSQRQAPFAMEDLGTLGGSASYAYGMNAAGQVVGNSLTAGNDSQHAFRWTGGVMQDLGTLGGHSSEAYAINDAGQVAGHSATVGDASLHAF